MQRKKQKTWIDGLIGWKPEGNVIETYWVGDPAIDQEKSNLDLYMDNLGKEHLVVRPGEAPSRMLVHLLTSAQWGNVNVHMNDAGHGTAPIVAFQLCVRFPDVEELDEPLLDGFRRLPEGLMNQLSSNHPSMVMTIGYWLINKYLLSGEEKKASSPGSTASGSQKNAEESTTASSATTGESDSKVAPTSAKTRSRRRKKASSG